MGIVQSYPFSDNINYLFSNTENSGGKAKLSLIPNPGQIFAQAFASDVGFTYDNTKAEFVAGILQHKDLTPAGSRRGAIYDATVDLNWNKNGAVTATLNGTPTIVGGKLQCHGVHGVRYVATTAGQGAIKFRFTPNYTTVPATNINLVGLHQAAGNQNRIILTHSPSGGLRVTLTDSAGTAIHNAATIGGNPSIVSGTEYEVELNWDNVAGVIRAFWNGALQGTLSPGPWAHAAVAGVLSVGADANVYNTCNASFNDVIQFNTVQHTALYTPGYTIPPFIYAGSKIDGPNFTYTGVGTVLSVDDGTVVEAGAPRYIVGLQYWNGSAWVVSNGTYAQANDFATILANIMSFDTGGGGVLPWSIVFTDSNTQSSVDDFSVEVTGQKYPTLGYMEPLQGVAVQELISYTHEVVDEATTEVRLILSADGALKYHNGSTWVSSNGTAAQSNDLADFSANINDFNPGNNSEVKIRWLFISAANDETSELDLATLEYDFGAVFTDPLTCLMYGYVLGIDGVGVENATVTFTLKKKTGQYSEAAGSTIAGLTKTVTTDSNGYFDAELIRSSEFEGSGIYTVKISYSGNEITKTPNGKIEITVPDAETKDITDLITDV